MAEYRKREGAFQNGETVYRADEAALTAERPDGARIAIPWESVTRARLTRAPAGRRPARRLFTVGSTAGILSIDNMHFVRRGAFEARDGDFDALVAESAGRIANRAPRAGQYLGLPALAWTARLMLAAGGLGVLGVAITALTLPFGGWPMAVFLDAALLAFALPLLVRRAVQTRPRRAPAAGLGAALHR